MGEGLSGQDFAWVIYLVVYLLVAIGWLRQDRHAADAPGRTTSKPGFFGFIARERWACGGALWGGIVWFALAAGAWWYGDAMPGPLTFPLAVIGGFGARWLLSRVRRT